MNLLKNRLHTLMNEAGDGQGGGSLLTSNSGGGGSSASQGGEGNQPGANSQGAPASAGAAGGGAQGGQASDWRSALPVELRDDPSLKTIVDVQSLAKGYVHAQKLVGAEKIAVPSKHATPDDWKQVYAKLGLPADVKDYQLKLDESATLDKSFVEQFKATAHGAGILPHQAQQMADWFQKANANAELENQKSRDAYVKAELGKLEQEWGAAYKQNLNKAGSALRELNSPELVEYLDKTGLGNNPLIIKAFAAIADKFMKEDAVVGAGEAGKVFTPAQAVQEANKIMADFNHPYHVKDHPNHRAAVKEVQDLFEMAARK